jgi:TonB family protein
MKNLIKSFPIVVILVACKAPSLPGPNSNNVIGYMSQKDCPKLAVESYPPPIMYPEEAWRSRIHGEVRIRAIVDENGKVVEAFQVSGPSAFRDAAIQNTKEWVFKPLIVDGIAVRSCFTVSFIFLLKP